jgi:hypothetical protein
MTQTTSLLRINNTKSGLNKKQKEFNLLTEKIAFLEQQIPELKNAYDQILARYPKELTPLVMEYQTFRVEIVHIMDRAYQSNTYRNLYLLKLAYLISEASFELITHYHFEELIPIFNKYSPESYEVILARHQATQAVKPTEEPIQIPETSASSVSFHELDPEEQRRIKAAQRLSRMQEQNLPQTTRSVRNVYTDLVKAFHPDRELDEIEKLRKTEIMKSVTEAYQRNNLMELLRLQIDFNQIDQSQLENLDKAQLNYYNKVLGEQLDELEAEKQAIQKQLADITGLLPQHINSLTTAVVKFNTNVNQAKTDIKEIRNLIKVWSIPSRLHAYLKTYRIPNELELEEVED